MRRNSGSGPGSAVDVDADGACLAYSDRRVGWPSAPSGLSKRACLDQMHRVVDLGCCDADSVAAADAFAGMFAAAIAAAGKAVAEDFAGTAFGKVRTARHAGRLAACIPCNASYADVRRPEKQCSVHT